MKSQTPIKILIPLAALCVSACGVKGPPEPPLVNEASVKRIEAPAPAPAEPAAPPVIFPVKKDKEKQNKKTNKQGQ